MTNRRSTLQNRFLSLERTLRSPAELASDQDLAIHPFGTFASDRGRSIIFTAIFVASVAETTIAKTTEYLTQ